MRKFKIGERVKIIGQKHNHGLNNGTEVTIREFGDGTAQREYSYRVMHPTLDTRYVFESDIESIDTFVLPDKWFVYYKNKEQFDILKAFYDKGWSYCDPGAVPRFGYCSTDNVAYGNNWVNSYNISDVKKEHTEITWEQFEKYVLNNKQTNMKIIGYRVIQELPDIAVGTVGELIQQGTSRIFGFKATSGWQHRRYYEDVIQKSPFFEAIYEKTEVTFTLGTPARRFTIKEVGKITCQGYQFTLDEIKELFSKLDKTQKFGETGYYFDDVQVGCKADGVKLNVKELNTIITKIQEYGK